MNDRAFVAPFVGAWIEMLIANNILCVIIVAPFVGAWIEIEIRRGIVLLDGRSLRGSVD